MTKEEQQFNQWFDEYADGVKVFEEADMKQAYLQGRAELEKENAELKESYCLRRCKHCEFLHENGNCLKVGGYFTAVDNKDCPILKDKVELIKENAELKEINTNTLSQLNLDNGELIIENEKLKKENAELKNQLNKVCGIKGCMQLTKAKEIIKDLCGMVRELNKPNVQLTNIDYSLSEAKQFLKETE